MVDQNEMLTGDNQYDQIKMEFRYGKYEGPLFVMGWSCEIVNMVRAVSRFGGRKEKTEGIHREGCLSVVVHSHLIELDCSHFGQT